MWQLYSLGAAFCLATADALTKATLVNDNEYYVTWVRLLFTAIPLAFYAYWVPIPNLDPRFWFVVLMLAPTELLAISLYVKAIKLSPISLVIPFLAFTPVFLLGIAYMILGEMPSNPAVAGVLMVAVGAYILSISEFPVAVSSILKDKGVQLMLIVSFLFSLTSTLAKIAIIYSSPSFIAVYYYIMLVPLFIPILRLNYNGPMIRRVTFRHIFIGLFLAFMVFFHSQAISMTKVANMIAVKRMSLIFSILYGRYMFKEKAVVKRLAGGIIMVLGVFLITLF